MSVNERERINKLGVDLKKRLFNDNLDPYSLVPDNAIMHELDFGLMRARDELVLTERMMVWLTSAIILQRMESLSNLVRMSLKEDIEARSIVELVVQITIYSGFELVEPSMKCIQRVCDEEGAKIDDQAMPYESVDEIRAEELALREQLHGARHTSGYASPDAYFTKKIYSFGALFGYGVIWRRPGLTLRERMVCALASMTTIGGVEQSLRKFALSALNLGMSIDEIAEVSIQTAPISGLWRANGALMVLEEIFPGGKVPGND